MFDRKNNSGVSPVIGIILMVAVTVGLVALASTIVFDLGNNVNEPADVSAELTFDNESDEITATVVRNENAAAVFLRIKGSHSGDIVGTTTGSPRTVDSANVGGTGTVTTGLSGTGTVEVVAIVEGSDGQQQVISSLQFRDGTDGVQTVSRVRTVSNRL